MIVVRYRHETDENYFLQKMKKMKSYLEDVIDCVEHQDAEYEDDGSDDDYEEEPTYNERSRMSRRGRMSRRSNKGRYNY